MAPWRFAIAFTSASGIEAVAKVRAAPMGTLKGVAGPTGRPRRLPLAGAAREAMAERLSLTTRAASGMARRSLAYSATLFAMAAPRRSAMPGASSSARGGAAATLRPRGEASSSTSASFTPAAPSSVAWWIFAYQATSPVASPSMTWNCQRGRSRSRSCACSRATSDSSCAIVPGFGSFTRRMCQRRSTSRSSTHTGLAMSKGSAAMRRVKTGTR